MQSPINHAFQTIFPQYISLLKENQLNPNEALQSFIRQELPHKIQLVRTLQQTFLAFQNQYTNLILKRPRQQNLFQSLAVKASEKIDKYFYNVEMQCDKVNKSSLNSEFSFLNVQQIRIAFREKFRDMSSKIKQKYFDNFRIDRATQEEIAKRLYHLNELYHFTKGDLNTLAAKYKVKEHEVLESVNTNKNPDQISALIYLDPQFHRTVQQNVQKRCRPFLGKKDFFYTKLKSIDNQSESKVPLNISMLLHSVISKEKFRASKSIISDLNKDLRSIDPGIQQQMQKSCKQIIAQVEQLKKEFTLLKNNIYYLDIIRGTFGEKYKMQLNKLENVYYLSNIEKYLQDVQTWVEKLMNVEQRIIENRKDFMKTLGKQIEEKIINICMDYETKSSEANTLEEMIDVEFQALQNALNGIIDQQDGNDVEMRKNTKSSFHNSQFDDMKKKRLQEAEQRRRKMEHQKEERDRLRRQQMEEKAQKDRQKRQLDKIKLEEKRRDQQQRLQRTKQERDQKQRQRKIQQEEKNKMLKAQAEKKLQQKKQKEQQDKLRIKEELQQKQIQRQKRQREDNEKRQQLKRQKQEEELMKKEALNRKKQQQIQLEQQKRQKELEKLKEQERKQQQLKQEKEKRQKEMQAQAARKKQKDQEQKRQRQVKQKQLQRQKEREAQQKKEKQLEQQRKKKQERDQLERKRQRERIEKERQKERIEKEKKETELRLKKEKEQRQKLQKEKEKEKEAQNKKQRQRQEKQRQQAQRREKERKEKERKELLQKQQAQKKRKQQQQAQEKADRQQKQRQLRIKKEKEQKQKAQKQRQKQLQQQEERQRKAQQKKDQEANLQKQKLRKQAEQRQKRQLDALLQQELDHPKAARQQKDKKAAGKSGSGMNYDDLDDMLDDDLEAIEQKQQKAKVKGSKPQDDEEEYGQDYEDDFQSPQKEDQHSQPEGDDGQQGSDQIEPKELITADSVKCLNDYMKGTSYARKNKTNLEPFNTTEYYMYVFQEFVEARKIFIFDSAISNALLELGKELENEEANQKDLKMTVDTIREEIFKEYAGKTGEQQIFPGSRLIFPFNFKNQLDIKLIEFLPQIMLMRPILGTALSQDEHAQAGLNSILEGILHIFQLQEDPQLAPYVLNEQSSAVLSTFENHLPCMLILFAMHYETTFKGQINIDRFTIQRFFYTAHVLSPFYQAIESSEEEIVQYFDKISQTYEKNEEINIMPLQIESSNPNYQELLHQTTLQMKAEFLQSNQKITLVMFQILMVEPSEQEQQSQSVIKVTLYACLEKAKDKDSKSKAQITYFIVSKDAQQQENSSALFEMVSDQLDQYEVSVYTDFSRHNGLTQYSDWTLPLWARTIQKRKLSPLNAFRAITFSMSPYYVAYKELD